MTRLKSPIRRIVARIWGTLYEPRAVTAVMVTVYGIAVGLGITLLGAPAIIPAAHWIQIVAGLFYLTGTIGAPSAWVGAWWLERAITIAMIGGVILSSGLLLTAHPPAEPAVWALLLAGIGFVVALFLTRTLRTWSRPFAPGHGPLSGEEAAAARAALDED
jgi:hypothetical protein